MVPFDTYLGRSCWRSGNLFSSSEVSTSVARVTSGSLSQSHGIFFQLSNAKFWSWKILDYRNFFSEDSREIFLSR